GDRNRSVLVRVPLGWTTKRDMFSQVNPQDKEMHVDASSKQTVEIRSADCSADIYQLLSALCVACRYGLELPNGLEIADKTYVDVNIHKEENKARVASL
ncbi:MAG TPA: glutamine synthetase, partial [Alistipes sp.]|nr:glutamine synthetase [Alistipes sp.]